MDAPTESLADLVERLLGPTPVGAPTDVLRRTPILEVELEGRRVEARAEEWRSYTGRRWKNGEEEHGPVYNLGTDVPYDGRRVCPCRTCEAGVAPHLRSN